MRNNDEMERWRLREIKRELLEIAARARVSTADHAAALLAEAKRIERVIRGLTAKPRIPRRKPENPRAAQRSNAVADYLNGGSWKLAAEYVEIESGKRSNNRPQLAGALAACKKHKAKLVIAKLDRLARNVHFISGLMDAGVEFVACDMPHANKLTIHILAAVAEHEREAISARTKAALAAAKARGKQLGGPKLDEARIKGRAALVANADRFAANTLPIVKQIQASGVSTLRGIADALAARGVPTARGGAWTPVSNLMRRAAS